MTAYLGHQPNKFMTTRLKSKPFSTENLHLLTLWAFAVAQPLYALLGEQTGFFVARKADRLDLILFVLTFTLVFPLAPILIKELAGLAGEKARNAFHSLWLALFLALFILPFMKLVAFLPDFLILGIALGAGIGLTMLYWKRETFGRLLTFLSPAVVIFPLLFLFSSNVTPILLKTDPALNSSTQASTKAQPPVVMIIWDELPLATLLDENGEIDAERYPNFARFSGDATWFRNTYSVGGSTLWAVPAILTGQLPETGSTHTRQELETNLFTMLKDSHELTNVSEKYTTLCPEQFCKKGRRKHLKELVKALPDITAVYLHLVSPPGMAALLPDVSNNWGDFAWSNNARPKAALSETPVVPEPDKEVKEAKEVSLHIDRPTTRKGKDEFPGHKWGLFEKFLGRIPAYNSGGRPSVNFLHIVFPHVPYNYMPSGKYYRVGPYKYFTTWQNEREIYFDLQRHLLQVGATDAMMGKLLDRLEAQNLYDEALIIILADHGASWTTPGEERRMLNEKNYRDLIRVPMWIKRPHQKEAEIIDTPVRTIDLLPTVADLLDLELPGEPGAVDGHSVFAADYPDVKQVRVVDNLGKNIYHFPLDRDLETPSFKKRLALLGSGSPDKIFTFGPQALAGKSLDKFRIETASGWTFQLGEPENYANVDLTESFTPTLVEGKVYAHGKTLPKNLVIAVNGIIHNSFPLMIPEADGIIFGGMIPESSLRDGANEIRIFEQESPHRLIEIPRKS